jgi:hypothetical protein
MNGVFVIMITTMPRCLHMFDSGFQCVGEALETTDFCEAHQKVVAFESELEDSIWRKTLLRVVALILLLMFLIPLFYTLRDLYFGPPVKAQEVW